MTENKARPSLAVCAAVFDMDGVLFDTEALCLESWKAVADEKRLDDRYDVKIKDVFMKCIGTTELRTKEIVLESYGDDFEYDNLRREASVWFHNYIDEYGMPVKSGAVELLGYLRRVGLPIALASSTRYEKVIEELESAGLAGYFDVIVGGDMLKRSKPAPDIYLMACEKLGISPSVSAAVEDSFNGVRSAYSAGMKVIMVPDLLMPDEEMRGKCVLTVSRLDELVGVITPVQPQ